MTEESFLTVERREENEEGWLVVARDADWETKLVWTRTNAVKGDSNVQVNHTIVTLILLLNILCDHQKKNYGDDELKTPS